MRYSPAPSLVILACLAFPCPRPARAQSAPTNTPPPVSFQDISRAMGQAQTIFTRFTQERHLSLFVEPLRSEGYLCFQKPGHVRWETTTPYRSILLSDGTGVAQFEWLDGRWSKLELGLADALQHVLAQIGSVMEGQYSGKSGAYAASVKTETAGPVITLVPQDERIRKVMAQIEVHLAGNLKAVRRVVLRENGGDYTDIQFTEQVASLTFPPRTFDRNAPADLDPIRKAAVKALPSR